MDEPRSLGRAGGVSEAIDYRLTRSISVRCIFLRHQRLRRPWRSAMMSFSKLDGGRSWTPAEFTGKAKKTYRWRQRRKPR